MALATHLYFFASLLGRARTGQLSLESGKQWVRALIGGQPASTTGTPT
jgi:heme exporter protein C